MITYKELRHILFYLIALAILACDHAEKKGRIVDEFYTKKGEFDWSRFPLIKPYEAATVVPSQSGWYFHSADTTGLPESVPGIKRINVIDSIIYIFAEKTILKGQPVKQAWFVIIPKSSVFQGFKTGREYQEYLSSKGIKDPKMYNPTEIFQHFDRNDTLNWEQINERY